MGTLQYVCLWVSLTEPLPLGLHHLEPYYGGGSGLGSHVVQHQVLHSAVDLLPPEHAVVESHGHGYINQLEHIKTSELNCCYQSQPLCLVEIHRSGDDSILDSRSVNDSA